MSILPLLLLALLTSAFLVLVYYRLAIGRKYSVHHAALSLVLFAYGYYLLSLPSVQGFIPNGASSWFTLQHVQEVIGALFCLSVAYLINGLIRKYIYPRRLTWEGDSKVPLLIQYIVTFVIYLITVIVIVGVVYKLPITGLITASGAVVLVLGYSARSMIDEIFAGIAMNINAPFEKGDLIQSDDAWYYVKDIDWRSITFQDMDNNYVMVPNTKVAASNIRNLDRPNTMVRRTTYFRAEYNIPPAVVVAEATAAIEECPAIAPHPWNFCSYYDCDEKGMRYKLHFHVHHYDNWYVASDELINAIWYRFARKGIRFAHQRRLNYTSSLSERKVLADSAYDEHQWRVLCERFKQVPMFDGLTREDMEELARSAKLHIIGSPEWIIKAGSERHSMFLLATGAADVYEVDEDGKETLMATMGESETIGLMSLLTGESQKTTVRANQECAVWEIDSESLHALFERKPEVMKSIATSVASWQEAERAALKTIAFNRQNQRKAIDQRSNRLSERIARFFQNQTQSDDSSEYTNY